MIRGIDVSHYQGTIDWPRVIGRYGLSFAAAKCTEGTAFYDSEYARNLAGMRGAGLQGIVAYHYARPGGSGTAGIKASAIAQARYFVDKARPELLHALVLDLEVSPLNQAQTKLWRQTFLAEVRRLVAGTGVKVGVYLGGYAANETGRDAFDDADFWWFPRYATTSPAIHWPTTSNPRVDTNTTGWAVPPAPHIWQWTPNLDGMDANVSNLTIAQLFGTPTPTPTTEDEPMFLVSLKNSAAQYVSDGQTRRGVVDVPYRDFLVARGAQHAGPDDAHPLPFEFDTVSGMNAAAGPLAATSPEYDGTKWVYPTRPDAPPTLDQITAAFTAALPEPSGDGITADQVKQAVKDALKEGTA